jgi:hypothetical protein
MAEKNESAKQQEEVKRTKHRSPNYPMIGLRKAVERVGELEGKYKRSLVPIHLAQELWSYKAHGSSGNQCVAALKAYSLLEVEGDGQDRRVRLSESGHRIVRGSPDRAELLKNAALRPPLHAELWKKYSGEGFPDDELLKHYLTWDRKAGTFNPDAVGSFIANFKDSLRFAGLLENGINGGAVEGENGGDAANEGRSVSMGDLIQWTSQGVDQLPQPRRVVGISDDGLWAFVEGSKTGLPMNELSVRNPKGNPKPEGTSPNVPPANPFYKPADAPPLGPGEVEEKKIFDEGSAVLRWPDKLSRESVEDFEYWVKGILRRLRRKAGMPPDRQGDEE